MIPYLYSIISGERRGLIPGILKVILWFCSGGYYLGSGVVRGLYLLGILPRQKLARPVISVGNITVGGVGKTPLVIALAEYLHGQHFRPAILTRGYMRGSSSGEKDVKSDEVQMLKAMLPGVPIGMGRDRLKSAREILAGDGADIFLLDDGFQHWRLKRDLDIVVIDSSRPFGNGQLLPRGFLREPKSVLARAQVFVLTKTDAPGGRLRALKDELYQLNPGAVIVETVHHPLSFTRISDGEIVALPTVRDRKVAIASSIGDPHDFLRVLRRLGAVVQQKFVFMDHHVYQSQEVEGMVRCCRESAIRALVTTAKDAAKLKQFLRSFEPELEVLVLNIRLEITKGQDDFFHRVDALLQR